MSRGYEQELFNLLSNDDSKLTKEDIAEYLNRDGFDINKEIFIEGDMQWQDKPSFLICEAVLKCRFEVVEALVENGAKLDILRTDDVFHPIHLAVCYNKIDMVKLFIQNEVDLLAKDAFGYTALTISVSNSNYEVAKLILDNLDDSEMAQFEKDFGLFRAVTQSNREMAKILLDNGANPNVRHSASRLTPIHVAVKKPHIDLLNIPLINLLIDSGAKLMDPEYTEPEFKGAENFVRELIKQRKITKEIKAASIQISSVKRKMAKRSKITGFKKI